MGSGALWGWLQNFVGVSNQVSLFLSSSIAMLWRDMAGVIASATVNCADSNFRSRGFPLELLRGGSERLGYSKGDR